jgi:outer membrane protein
VTATPDDSSEAIGLGADSTMIASLARRGPAIQQSEAAYTAARSSVRSALTPYLPTVSLSFNRGGNGLDSRFGWGDDRYAYSQTMSFNLQFPFFNQGTREEQIVRSRVAADNAEAQLRDARFLAQQQLTQYMSAFRSAEQRVQIQLASVEAAEEDLRVQQRRYSLGASTFLDVLNSQVTLNQARAALIQARFDARVAKAQIETLTGKEM